MSNNIETVPDCRLSLAYSANLTESDSDPQIALMHGFGHSSAHFRVLVEELLNRNISSVCFDIQTPESAGIISKNTVGINDYLRGFSKLIDKFRGDTKRNIDLLLGHSNGGLLVQEWLQNHPDENMEAVLLAPVPLQGLAPTVLYLLRKNPKTFLRFLNSFISSKGLKILTEKDVRHLFFDDNTSNEIVAETREELRHTSFRIFLEDVFRKHLRPKIKNTDRSTQLIISPTDALFSEKRYLDILETYSSIQQETVSGGHNAFVTNPSDVAEFVEEFVNPTGSYSPRLA